MNKIIQKEKERQDDLLSKLQIAREHLSKHKCFNDDQLLIHVMPEIPTHKQSLINLKEYMEESARDWNHCNETSLGDNELMDKIEEQLKQDIKEIEEMIKKYE